MNALLFEIGTEEIPAGYIKPALGFLAGCAEKRFTELGLKHGEILTAGTPRRLTVVVKDLQDKQEDKRQEHVGPAKKAGFDAQGNPTKAAMGFARSKGVTVDDLQVIATDKGEYLMAVEEVKGKPTSELLPELLTALITEIPFPKSMRWAESSMTFARPIQWLLALLNGEVVNLAVEGVDSGNRTRGHRFMAPDFFPVSDFNGYVQGLEERYVIVDPERRRRMVVEAVQTAVREKAGSENARPLLDESLVDTVTNLVEIPWGVCGSFDEKFLELPREALVTSMREHQKYFPVVDGDGNLLPMFVAVNNTDIADSEMAANGHERVLRARLEDGLFFFNEDKKHRLADRLDQLSGIVFQKKLGTMEAKSARIAQLAEVLAGQIVPEQQEQAVRAARLAKVDLLTEMVGEFPSLQGVIGGEYARIDGEDEAVAVAIREHYMPVRAGSALPKTLVGAVVGISDRLDTLVGCFAIGERPTGNKDSFGLRRQAIGLISIIRGLKLSLSLKDMVTRALGGYQGVVDAGPDVVEQVMDFIRLRFENELLASGYNQGVVEAATSVGFDDLTDCLLRIEALNRIRSRDSFIVLSGSFKRIRNITRENVGTEVLPELLEEDAEQQLDAIVRSVRTEILPMIKRQDYDKALEVLLQMKEPVDRFFDEVMVMAEDQKLRRNRLNLLTGLKELVLRIGDISRMDVD
ncbi:MAG TPA: glycine--tRNA ligase subunit beta [Desulfobulbus sp.]|nr:glycine--tRNA ligase subunit beta [Desulfobulbus sp.]